MTEYFEEGDISVIRTRYFDSNGDPVTTTAGYAMLEVYKDKTGRTVGEAYFDKDFNPAYRTKQPYVRYNIEELVDDENETVTMRVFYNARGDIVKTEEVK